MNEFELIYEIIAPTSLRREDVLEGIGDDGAVLAPPPGQSLVVVADTLVEGRHFPAGFAAADIGYRAAAVNLSDIAAMGATPLWATLALTLPGADAAWLRAFATGLASSLVPAGVALVGGDTTSGPLTVTVQIIGSVPPGLALTRQAARPGDDLYVSGTLGDAAGGLLLQEKGGRVSEAERFLLRRFARPEPRLRLGQALRGVAGACIDVSDGLVADVGHVAARSGCAIVLEAARIPLSSALRSCLGPEAALEAALGGGDDYELCFTAPVSARERVMALTSEAIGCTLTRIGYCESGSGVRVLAGDGSDVTPKRRGFRHF